MTITITIPNIFSKRELVKLRKAWRYVTRLFTSKSKQSSVGFFNRVYEIHFESLGNNKWSYTKFYTNGDIEVKKYFNDCGADYCSTWETLPHHYNVDTLTLGEELSRLYKCWRECGEKVYIEHC